MKVGSRGVIITNPTAYRVVNRNAISDGCGEDIVVGSVSNFTSASIRDWDALSVSVNFNLGRGQSSYTTYLVDGSPFVATEYNAARPNLLAGYPYYFRSVNDIPYVEGRPVNRVFEDTTFLTVKISTNATWGIFATEPLTLYWDEAGALHAAEEYTGTVMVAACMEDETCSFLRPFVNAYVVGGEVDMEVDGDTATLIYRYASKGEGEPLMLAAPHHMEYLEAPRVPLSHQFLSSKGKLTGVVAQEWRMQLDLPTISWRAPSGLDPESLWAQAIIEQLPLDYADSVGGLSCVDPYNFGKQASRVARLALIADELGQTALAKNLTRELEGALATWLTEQNEDFLVYDTVWGGVVSSQGLNNSMADFGNGWYNDHHFHYGYFAYAMAAAAHLIPGWHGRYGERADFLLGDIATMERNSTFFPHARHKDFWAWHSWADGLFDQGDGKNEESSTEAINAYYGIYLYGEATGNNKLRDWGRVLLHMEIIAVREYWHMKDDSVYDAVFAENRMVGNVNLLSTLDSTWFGSQKLYVHGINMIPFTPITEVALPCPFMAAEAPKAMSHTDGDPANIWNGYAYLGLAVLDKDQAWKLWTNMTMFGDGLTKATGMYWIATRPGCSAEELAQYPVGPIIVDPTCAANSACYGKGFTKGDCCPNDQGVFAECCPLGISYPQSSLVYKDITLPQGNCAAAGNEACLELGLVGDCCPTPEGIFLGCCRGAEKDAAKAFAADHGTCAAYSGCAAIGLAGDCCPNEEGNYLACCHASKTAAPTVSPPSTYRPGGKLQGGAARS